MSRNTRKFFQKQYPRTQAGLVAFVVSQMTRRDEKRIKFPDAMLADRLSISIPELHALREAAVRNGLLFLRPSLTPARMKYSITPFAEPITV